MNLVATLDAGEAARRIWDVVVIGAGPAGCMAARELARSGCQVLLIEAKRFPRSKVCGGCLNHHAAELLTSRGLGDIVSRTGALPLREFRIDLPDWTASYPLPAGWSVTRATLDSQLLSATLESGVNYLDEATARLVPGSPPDCRFVQVEHHGDAFTVAARIVICAEGLSRSASREPDLEIHVDADAFIGAGAILASDSVPESLRDAAPAGAVTMVVGNGGYIGISAAESGRYSLGRLCDHRSFGIVAHWETP